MGVGGQKGRPVEHIVRVEATVSGDTARLYNIVSNAAGNAPGSANAAYLQTGIVHHAIMLHVLGVIPPDDADEVRQLVASIGESTIMQQLFRDAWKHWSSTAGESDEPER